MKKIFFVIAVISFVVACKHREAEAEVAQRDTTITIKNSFSELFFDSLVLENYIAGRSIPDTLANEMRSFYNSRNYQYAWFYEGGIADYANTFSGMQNSYIGYSGDSSLYNARLHKMIDSLQIDSTIQPADPLILETELALTHQFLLYTYAAYAGRGINTKDLNWYIPRKKINPVGFLDSMLANKGKNLSSYEPVNRQYNLLKTHLLKYYELEKSGGWEPIIADKKAYRNGDSSLVIAAIKERLYKLGDLDGKDTTAFYTSQLTEGIKNFQRKHGLKEDGVAGPALVKSLNRPIHEYTRQILINMERMRWVPAEPAGDYLLVNIPEFRLHVFEKGSLAWSMDVVVGSTAHSTVIFNGDMKYVVFSPYWNVPPGILKNEVLPGIKRDKNYLVRHNMEWNNGNVRQKPGSRNSLGLVKFLFPNSYSIYLHDTPSKSLFQENKRAFSHGCIRLSDAKKMATYLLRNDSAWTDKKIVEAMNSGKEKFVTLKETIPVFIGYFTAWVNSKGELNFREDVYGHDKKLAEHLFSDNPTATVAK